MIEYLRGIIKTKDDSHLILDVNGVGYGIDIPLTTYENLAEEGEEAELFIFLYTREDSLKLFGFSSAEEREIFEVFINTSGIGPKTSIVIMSSIPPEEFVTAILTKDIGILTRIPGIGKKTAERLILELSDKVKLLSLPSGRKETTSSGAVRSRIEEAIQALIALGCKPFVASKAVNRAFELLGKDASTENLIREGLKNR